MLIDRNDQVINLFEIKFYQEPFVLTQAYADQLRQKMAAFRYHTETRKQLFWVLLSTFGLVKNKHSQGLIAQSLSLADLFNE